MTSSRVKPIDANSANYDIPKEYLRFAFAEAKEEEEEMDTDLGESWGPERGGGGGGG